MQQVAVIIATRNRKDLLRMSIAGALAQSVPVEISVMDDGSTDGTGEMVRAEFPTVIYERLEGPNGPSLMRNLAVKKTSARILIGLDDDAVLTSPRTIEQTVAEFDHPRVGAVGIPFVNVKKGTEILQRAPDDGQLWVHAAFIAAAFAIRRDAFDLVGGFRKELFYYGEEKDVCIRMLDRGYVVRLGRADPVEHHESPSRVAQRADLYGRRNDVLFVWNYVPGWFVLPRLLGTIAGGMRWGFKAGRPWTMFRGLAWGVWSIGRFCRSRHAVKRGTYRAYRKLAAKPIVMGEVEGDLVEIGE